MEIETTVEEFQKEAERLHLEPATKIRIIIKDESQEIPRQETSDAFDVTSDPLYQIVGADLKNSCYVRGFLMLQVCPALSG